jgi:molecular chaperone DnaK
MARDNRKLGEFNLDGLPPAPRGVPQIEVTFDIDANGILNVSAKDKATGKSHNIRIEAKSGLSQEEIDRMKREAEANADSDKKAKEEVDKLNEADGLVFQTEKQLKEYGDKIPAEKKTAIESALAELKVAHASKNIDKIDASLKTLNDAWAAASQDMYNATQKQGESNPNQSTEQQNSTKKDGENVTDVDFEEVK